MNGVELLAFLCRHRLCVQASVSSAGAPQAAVVGYAVSGELEIVFDTIGTTRKMQNLRQDPHVALVVGWDEGQTVQIEGVADEPTGGDLERLKRVYFAAWPDGVERQAWKDITYVRVRPTWVKYSDFRSNGRIVEIDAAQLRAASRREAMGPDAGVEPPCHPFPRCDDEPRDAASTIGGVDGIRTHV